MRGLADDDQALRISAVQHRDDSNAPKWTRAATPPPARRGRGPHYGVDFLGARHFAFSDFVFPLPQLTPRTVGLEKAQAELIGTPPPQALAALLRRSPFARVRLTIGR